jgi:hypothetical protein
MRDTYLRVVDNDGSGGGHDWAPVSALPTPELHAWLEYLSGGVFVAADDSPNHDKTGEDIRDRILIELRARELGLVSP